MYYRATFPSFIFMLDSNWDVEMSKHGEKIRKKRQSGETTCGKEVGNERNVDRRQERIQSILI